MAEICVEPFAFETSHVLIIEAEQTEMLRLFAALRRQRPRSRDCNRETHVDPVHLGEAGSVAWLYCRSCGIVWTRLSAEGIRQHMAELQLDSSADRREGSTSAVSALDPEKSTRLVRVE